METAAPAAQAADNGEDQSAPTATEPMEEVSHRLGSLDAKCASLSCCRVLRQQMRLLEAAMPEVAAHLARFYGPAPLQRQPS